MSIQVPKTVKRRCQVKMSDPCIPLITTISSNLAQMLLEAFYFHFVTVSAILVCPDVKPFPWENLKKPGNVIQKCVINFVNDYSLTFRI